MCVAIHPSVYLEIYCTPEWFRIKKEVSIKLHILELNDSRSMSHEKPGRGQAGAALEVKEYFKVF